MKCIHDQLSFHDVRELSAMIGCLEAVYSLVNLCYQLYVGFPHRIPLQNVGFHAVTRDVYGFMSKFGKDFLILCTSISIAFNFYFDCQLLFSNPINLRS